jgi:hypothetical protein
MKKSKVVTYRGYQVYLTRRKKHLYLTFRKKNGLRTRQFEVTSERTRREDALSEDVLGAKLLEGLKNYRRNGRHLRACPRSSPAEPKMPKGSYGAKVKAMMRTVPSEGMPKDARTGIAWAGNFILSHQPPKVLFKPVGKVTYKEHYELYTAFLRLELGRDSLKRYAYWLGRLTAGLIYDGLEPDCGDIFARFEGGDQQEAAGDACSYDLIGAMLRVEDKQPFSARFVLGLELSGAPAPSDLLFLRHSNIDPVTGKVTIGRQGTTAPAEFFLRKPVLQLYVSHRRDQRDGYVLADVVLSKEELSRAGSNPPVVERTKVRVREAGKRLKRLMEEFLRAAGSALSAEAFFRGIRKEFVAHMLSMSGKKTAVARMLGVTVGVLEKCNFPAEWQLKVVRDIVEQHVANIRAGVKGRTSVTKTQVLAQIKSNLTEELRSAGKAIECRHNALLAFLEKELACLAHARRQLAITDKRESKRKMAKLVAMARRVARAVDELEMLLGRSGRTQSQQDNLKVAA